MIAEKHDFKLPDGIGGSRRGALYRAGLAGALMIVLVIGLLMVENDEVPPAEPIATVALSPVEAPVLLPLATPAVASLTSDASEPGAAIVAEQGNPAQSEVMKQSELAQPQSSESTAVVAQSEPVTKMAVRKSVTPPGPGYMLQLGVFGDPSNADSLRDELDGGGFPAHVQSRVVLGPYPDRKAAQAAHDKLRRERKLDGMIIPPRKP